MWISILSSLLFSHSFVSDSLRPLGLQHTRLPCPSPTARACTNMSIKSVMPSNYLILCHLLPSCPQSFPASGSFPVSKLFASGGQNIGASASSSVLPMNSQDWFPLGWIGWMFLLSKRFSRVFSQFKSINCSVLSFLYSPTLTSIHDYWKNHIFD